MDGGCASVWQPQHGVGVWPAPEGASVLGLATAVWGSGNPRFCLAAVSGGGVRGRLLLARMPELFRSAEVESEILEEKDIRQPPARPAHEPLPAQQGMVRSADLGVPAWE